MIRNPVDSPWSWLVALAGMMNMLIVVGFSCVTGVLFIEMMAVFKASATSVSVIIGIKEAVFSIFALFSLGVLNDLVQTRFLIIAGGIAFCIGYSCCFFATNVNHLFVYSVFTGMGLSLSYLQNIVIVSKYFDKWQTLAIGVTTSGVSLGTIILPFLVEFVLLEYSLKGCMLIIGAISLNIAVFASLMRPLEVFARSNETLSNSVVDTAYNQFDKLTTEVQSDIVQRLDHQQELVEAQNASLLDGSTTGKSSCLNSKQIRKLSLSDGDLISDTYNIKRKAVLNIEILESIEMQSHPNIYACGEKQLYSKRSRQKHLLDPWSISNGFSTNTLFFQEFYEIPRFNQTVDSINTCSTVVRKKKKIKVIDTGLLKNAAYMSYLLSISMCQSANALLFVFLPPYFKEKMLDNRQISMLLSIYGIFNFIFRFVFGFLADSGLFKRHHMCIFTCLCIGILSNCLRLLSDFNSLLVYIIVFGSFNACFFVTTPLILIDFFGREVQARSMGASILLTGTTNLAIAPILGYLHDVTNSYGTSFNVIGGSYILGSAILALITVPLLKKKENTTNATTI